MLHTWNPVPCVTSDVVQRAGAPVPVSTGHGGWKQEGTPASRTNAAHTHTHTRSLWHSSPVKAIAEARACHPAPIRPPVVLLGIRMSRRPRLLLGVTGSVAAVKFPALVIALCPHVDVRVVLTRGAVLMAAAVDSYDAAASAAYTALVSAGTVKQYLDEDEWKGYADVGTDPVLHIELRQWADALLVAPLCANTLAKLAGGLCDSLLVRTHACARSCVWGCVWGVSTCGCLCFLAVWPCGCLSYLPGCLCFVWLCADVHCARVGLRVG